MKRIHRLILQEIIPPSLIALLVLTFVVFTREFGRISQLFIRQRADAATVLEAVAALLPQILIYTVPISLLVGALVGFSRLSSDSEVVALGSSGVSVQQMLWPVFKVAVGVAILTGLLTFLLFPWGHSHSQEIRSRLGASPIKSEIKPGVFFEDLPDHVLYVADQNLQSQSWKGVFLSDSGARERRIILAREGQLVLSEDKQRLQLNFQGGLSYTIDPETPEKYKWSRFGTLQVPVQFQPRSPVERSKRPREMYLPELRREIRQGTPRNRLIAIVELNRRIALPVAAVLFGVLGVTLGIRHHRSGRAYGIVVSMLIAFSYYALLESGVRLSEDRTAPIWIGLWGPNILLAVIAAVSLYIKSLDPGILSSINRQGHLTRAAESLQRLLKRVLRAVARLAEWLRGRLWRMPTFQARIARVIDLYVARLFVLQLGLALLACMSLFYLFTFFELINDIFTNSVTYGQVGEYFLYLLPQVLALLVPISTLIATLITFGLLERTNQIVALKASGISLYQITLPVFGAALLLSGLSYINQEYVLPFANQRQDDLRSVIKGRPVQTHYTPGRSWIFGEDKRLFNYTAFDPDRDKFVEISVYELDIPNNDLISHTYARNAFWDRSEQGWIFEEGWIHRFADDPASARQPFERFDRTVLRFGESPAYFEKGVRQSSKMTFPELSSYIQSLQKGGFEVDHLRTELYTKISFPLVPLIMALLGVPFAFTLGRKGALYGIAAGVLIGMVYWGAFGTFGVLGASGLLAPALAAWGPNILFASSGAILFLGVRT